MAIYKTLVKKISIPPEMKTKQKDYLAQGNLAIIDQGQPLIGGYSNSIKMQIRCNLPVIVFGDHTRAVKYINFPFGAGADGIKILEPKKDVTAKYLYYGTQYLTLTLPDKGYARHYQYLEKEDLYLPPIPEQERIVAHIEELFSELDAGVETLKKTKAQLDVYRQAVLKEAFEGHLTKSKQVSASVLSEFIEKPHYGTSKKCTYENNGYKAVYRIPNINHAIGRISKDDIKYAQFTQTELQNIELHNGDLLIIRSNGSINLVGRAAIIYESDTDATFAGYLMRLRINDPSILNPFFLLHYLQSHSARIYIESKAKSTSGVHNINSQEISQLPIPLYKIEDQKKIVAEIESRLSICNNIEQTIDAALEQSKALRHSILKEAFEGKI